MTELYNLIETSRPESWLETLPEFQQQSIATLQTNGASFDDIVSVWLKTTIGATSPFSAGGSPSDDTGYIDKLKAEFRKFLCGSKEYDSQRLEIAKEQKHIHTFVISTMSVAIGQQIGAAAAVIAPIIAMLLASLGKIALNAWCASPQ